MSDKPNKIIQPVNPINLINPHQLIKRIKPTFVCILGGAVLAMVWINVIMVPPPVEMVSSYHS
jgi:hypothetical protein